MINTASNWVQDMGTNLNTFVVVLQSVGRLPKHLISAMASRIIYRGSIDHKYQDLVIIAIVM